MEKRLLFINPCLRPGSSRKYPPVGLAYILTALRKSGYEFDLIDMDADNLGLADVADRLKGKHYDLCGFGCIVTGLRLVRDLANTVRDYCPECLIVAGNSVATSIPELLLRNTEVDVAVLGEGDITIVELVNALSQGMAWQNIPGIAYLEHDGLIQSPKRAILADLDAIGFPDWTIFDIHKYNLNMQPLTVADDKGQIILPLNSARGCPFSCTFCYHVFKGERYRKYTEEAVRKEFIRLTNEFGATFIMFWDELSFPTISSAERMVSSLEKLPFRTNWDGATRADLFSKKDVELTKRMREVGCQSIGFSIENASLDILKAMNKKISLERAIEHSLVLWESGITPLSSIIFGYPQETPETIKATLDLCDRCNIYPSVGFLQPLPGTPIYQMACEKGLIPDELEYLLSAGDRQDLHINMTEMSDTEFQDCVVDGLRELSKKMNLEFINPLKTGVYQKPKR